MYRFMLMFVKHYPKSSNILAHGCPDPAIEVGTSMERNGDSLTVTCDRTGAVSHLICDSTSGSWIGETPDCSKGLEIVKVFMLNLC